MSASQQAPEGADRSAARSVRMVVLLLALLVLVGTVFFFWNAHRLAMEKTEASVIHVSGRLEGYETQVAPKATGLLTFVGVYEGDRVRRGQILARLTDEERVAQLHAAQARVAAARQSMEQSRIAVSVLQSQSDAAHLLGQQTRVDTSGQLQRANATLAQAQAQLAQARAQVLASQADLRLAERNASRFTALATTGDASRQQADEAQTTLTEMKAALIARQASVNAAFRAVQAAQGERTLATTSLYNPLLRDTQSEELRRQILQAQTQTAVARANVRAAQANRDQAAAALADLIVRSPIDGVVTVRALEPGAVVSAGRTILTLLDPRAVYLRGFIPDAEIGRVRTGQKADVFLDSDPNRPLPAHVAAIDAEASFTPENIYFKDDRVRQVFGVRIALEHAEGFAKPGMPADAEIDIGSSP